MSYKDATALQKHLLDSILPHSISAYQPKQILKNRQFYKPQTFIWNNPHRASQQIFKFYHKYNEIYYKEKQPQIKALQLHDKKQKQYRRLMALSQIKNTTRSRFYSRQRQNMNLEQISGTLRKKTQPEINLYQTSSKRFSTLSHYHSKPSKYEPMIPSYTKSKFVYGKFQNVQRMKDNYSKAVKQFDAKKQKVQKLIIQQAHSIHDKIYEEFQIRKQLNEKTIKGTDLMKGFSSNSQKLQQISSFVSQKQL